MQNKPRFKVDQHVRVKSDGSQGGPCNLGSLNPAPYQGKVYKISHVYHRNGYPYYALKNAGTNALTGGHWDETWLLPDGYCNDFSLKGGLSAALTTFVVQQVAKQSQVVGISPTVAYGVTAVGVYSYDKDKLATVIKAALLDVVSLKKK